MFQTQSNEIEPPSAPPDDHKISWLWFLLYVLFYLFVSVLYIRWGYWANIIFFPLVFFTTAIVYLIYKSLLNQNKLNGNLIKFSDLFRGYSHSFFGGGLFALLTELWITTVVVLTILLLFHNSRALQAIMNDDFETAHDYTCNNFAIHLYLFFTSFFVAGLIEEISKGYLLQYIVKLYLPHFNYIKSINMNQFIWFGIVIGLGFGTIEGIIYVCIYGGSQGFLSQIILWLIRAFIAIPFHTITGCLWGIKYFDSIRSSSSSSWTKIGYQQVLLHGLYDFIEMEIALDLVCNDSNIISQILITLIIAVVYTLLSIGFTWWQYKKLKKKQFIPDQQLIN